MQSKIPWICLLASLAAFLLAAALGIELFGSMRPEVIRAEAIALGVCLLLLCSCAFSQIKAGK